MKIKNDRLSLYVLDNSDSKVRSRAKEVTVEQLDFSEDYESVSAIVLGSSDARYAVHFYGLQHGMLSSSCTCPYDWGNICKHEVAVALQIDGFVDGAEAMDLAMVKNKVAEKPKFSATAPYTVPFKNSKDLTSNFIRKNTSHDAFLKLNYAPYDTYIIVNEPEYIHLRFEHRYRYDRPADVQMRKAKESISLLCSCKAINRTLCRHQAMALQFIRDALPTAFESIERINAIKQKMLDDYGLKLTNTAHKKLFDFKYLNGELTLSLARGILGKKDLDIFEPQIEKLCTWEGSLNDRLPFESAIETNKKKGFAIGIVFNSTTYTNEPPLFMIPIMGNLKKDRSGFASKIEAISDDDLLHRPELFEEDDVELIRMALELTEDFPQLLNHKGPIAIDHYLHGKLKKIVPLLKNTLLYAVDPYQKLGKNNLIPITVLDQSTTLSFHIKKEEPFYNLESFITIEGKKSCIDGNFLGNNFLFIEKNNRFYLNKDMSYCKMVDTFKETPIMRIPERDFDAFYERFILPLSRTYLVEFPLNPFKIKNVASSRLKKKLFVSEQKGYIVFRPVLDYEGTLIDVIGDTHSFENNGNTNVVLKVDAQLRNNFITEIEQTHPKFKDQLAQGLLYLKHIEFVDNNWFLRVFPLFQEHDIEVYGYDSLPSLKYNPHTPTINVAVQTGIDWFDVKLNVAFGDLEVSLKDLKKSILANDQYVRLADGSLGILPKQWLDKYAHLFRSGETSKEHIKVSKFQLSVIDSIYDELDNTSEVFKNHQNLKQKLLNFTDISKVSTPKEVNASLRDYQKEGLNWLNFLDEYGFGGCLADDMGLGKTLQVITFLRLLKNKVKPKKPHLVVVPTSLIFNWCEEISKFCPSLSLLVFTGSDRAKDTSGFTGYDIVLTTYGTLLRDVALLKDFQFQYLILDESQAIKNPNSKRYKAVRILKAKNRLVLSGTPIENNTLDIYAQMTFVNPGILGTLAGFRNNYATPIDKNKDEKITNELSQLLSPFLLRRTKEQVAKELPSKSEQILYCTMGKKQREIYDAYRNTYRNLLTAKIAENGLQKSKIYVLEGLTKLRQICDSPLLLSDGHSNASESIKIEELMTQILEKTGKHKVLVFSQFVKMLQLIKQRLENEDISHEYLDGKTKNRQEKVENFQNDVEKRVFLISLKAGGTGLNLTAADYVYIVDPWWNPAVEAQAIDRCYRIGQAKKVFAYKMICKDTVEEKILKLQTSKKKLSTDIIKIEESFVKSLSREAIDSLFAS